MDVAVVNKEALSKNCQLVPGHSGSFNCFKSCSRELGKKSNLMLEGR